MGSRITRLRVGHVDLRPQHPRAPSTNSPRFIRSNRSMLSSRRAGPRKGDGVPGDWSVPRLARMASGG